MADVVERARRWMLDAALPYWTANGQEESGLWYEQVGYDGRPDPGGQRRMRVQARQTYCWAHARRMGWHPAPGLEKGLGEWLRTSFEPDGKGGWIHLLNPDGSVKDDQRDFYDMAFAIFALSEVHRTLGDPLAREIVDRTLDWMDRDMKGPVGGFIESLPPALPRRTNPHMHLLEAMLAWLEATGDDAFRQRANTLLGLFADHFFDKETGSLGEYFTVALEPCPPPQGDSREPGHHAEWTWLLHRAKAAGCRDETGKAKQLYDWLNRHGLDDEGLAVDECDREGEILRATRRCWVECELMKSHLVMGETAKAHAVMEKMLDQYLATDVPGIWIDVFDGEGKPDAPVVPASTLYHLMVAVDLLLEHG